MKKYHHCVKFTYPLSFQTRIPKVDQLSYFQGARQATTRIRIISMVTPLSQTEGNNLKCSEEGH